MAWGGQQFKNFDSSIAAPALVPLIKALYGSANTRAADFATAKAQSEAILGLGISFYTKLLFFLRPAPDAYILDQWTAKSITLLQRPPIIRLTRPTHSGFCRAEPNTTPNDYEAFCRASDAMSAILWPKYLGATGEHVEMVMFDRNRPDGFWRGFVRINFAHPVSGDLLFRGAESLTRALDYRVGLLVLKFRGRLHVISITTHCCQWSQEDCFRFLLARLHEIIAEHRLPATLVFPPGSVLCPDWFKEALERLGITLQAQNEPALPERSDAVECDEMEDDVEHNDPRLNQDSKFDQFWTWLSDGPRTVPTFAGRGEITGRIQNEALSLDRNIAPIQKSTVRSYFDRYPNNPIGNERWVYAFIKNHPNA